MADRSQIPGARWGGARLRIGAAFSLLALLLFTAVGWLSGEQARREGERTAQAGLQRLADRLTQGLESGLFERYREIGNLATLESLIDDEVEPARWRALLERLRATFPHYAWIGVTDPRGTVLASTQGVLEGRDVSQRPWFIEGRQTPFVGEVHDALLLSKLLPRADNEPLRLLDFAAPMRRAGQLRGVLGAHVDWRWIEQQRSEVQASVSPDRQVEVLLVNRAGQVLQAPDGAVATDSLAPVLQALSGGSTRSVWPDGRAWFAAVAHGKLPREQGGLGWSVVVRQPEATAVAHAQGLRQRIWLFGAAGALLFGLVGWGLAGRLTAPLRAAAQQVRLAMPQVAAGAGRDEVAQLSHALAELVQQLRERERALLAMNESLEARVQQRTESLVRANEDLRSFSRSVSHDLRGPMGSMSQLLRLLLEDDAATMSERTRRVVGEVATECDRLRQLTEELLTLAMVEQRALERAPVSMRELVEKALAEVRRAAPRQAEIVLEDLPAVQGDETLLRQVWVNLLSNAFKFTSRSEAPRIAIRARREGHEHVFSVEDNGAGFEMSQAPRLFGIFQRLHRPSEFPGTGVGLSIVRRVVHRHGGRVWAQAHVGEGAAFFFTLPVAGEP